MFSGDFFYNANPVLGFFKVYPCYYGIDTPTSEELAAAKMNVEGLCKDIGADSLSYLSIEDMLEAIGLPPNNVCTACFSGDYLNGGKEDELDL